MRERSCLRNVVAQNEANSDFIYTYSLEKELFSQKLLITRETFKKPCQLTLSQKRQTSKSRSVAVCIPSLFANNFNEAKNLFEFERCYLKILTGDKFHFPTQFFSFG